MSSNPYYRNTNKPNPNFINKPTRKNKTSLNKYYKMKNNSLISSIFWRLNNKISLIVRNLKKSLQNSIIFINVFKIYIRNISIKSDLNWNKEFSNQISFRKINYLIPR